MKTNSSDLSDCNNNYTFQDLLRESDAANKRFHGNAMAISYGLQPWIDALEKSVNK